MKKKKNIKVFFDMDGTLAKYKFEGEDAFYEKGFFLNLEPEERLKDDVSHPEIFLTNMHLKVTESDEVYILSSVIFESPFALLEKNAWLDKYFWWIPQDHRIFLPNGKSKAEFVERLFDCKLNKNFVLVDDYNKNLIDWEFHGGTAVKFINDVNNKRGTWKGATLR